MKITLSVFLTCTIIISGIYCSYQARLFNMNKQAELKDAVTGIMLFVRTIKQPANFTVLMQKTVTALRVAAGLKTMLKSGGLDQQIHQSHNLVYLPGSKPGTIQLNIFTNLAKNDLLFQSIILKPELRPPRKV